MTWRSHDLPVTDGKGKVPFHVSVFPTTMLLLGNLEAWDLQGWVDFHQREKSSMCTLWDADVRLLGERWGLEIHSQSGLFQQRFLFLRRKPSGFGFSLVVHLAQKYLSNLNSLRGCYKNKTHYQMVGVERRRSKERIQDAVCSLGRRLGTFIFRKWRYFPITGSH